MTAKERITALRLLKKYESESEIFQKLGIEVVTQTPKKEDLYEPLCCRRS